MRGRAGRADTSIVVPPGTARPLPARPALLFLATRTYLAARCTPVPVIARVPAHCRRERSHAARQTRCLPRGRPRGGAFRDLRPGRDRHRRPDGAHGGVPGLHVRPRRDAALGAVRGQRDGPGRLARPRLRRVGAPGQRAQPPGGHRGPLRLGHGWRARVLRAVLLRPGQAAGREDRGRVRGQEPAAGRRRRAARVVLPELDEHDGPDPGDQQGARLPGRGEPGPGRGARRRRVRLPRPGVQAPGRRTRQDRPPASAPAPASAAARQRAGDREQQAAGRAAGPG